jgi:hypothetical protein
MVFAAVEAQVRAAQMLVLKEKAAAEVAKVIEAVQLAQLAQLTQAAAVVVLITLQFQTVAQVVQES